MYPADDSARLVSDVDSLVVVCTRSLEGADQLTRRSLAKLVAHVLATTQVQRVVPAPEPPKKAKKGQNVPEDDEDALPGMHIQAEEAKPVMTPHEMFAQLSVQFNKPQASKKTRVGIFDFYAALLTHLGSGWVETSYGLVITHLMNEIVANPRNSSTRYETLLVRALVEVLLRDLVGVRMLGEQAQISAIQELSTVYLKRWPALMPGQTAPNPLCLVVALKEVAGLLQQLGNAPPPVQVRFTRILPPERSELTCRRMLSSSPYKHSWDTLTTPFASTPPGLFDVSAILLRSASRRFCSVSLRCCSEISASSQRPPHRRTSLHARWATRTVSPPCLQSSPSGHFT